MKFINLLPETELKELKLEFASKHLLKFFVVSLISLLILILGAVSVNVLIKSQIAANNIEISELQAQLNSSDNQALQKEIIGLNSQIKNISVINQQHYLWSKALTELGNLAPSDLHIDLLTVDRTGQIVINGTTDDRDSVLTFWSNVKKSRYFMNINFPLKNLEKPTDTPFTFTFFINPKSIQLSQ